MNDSRATGRTFGRAVLTVGLVVGIGLACWAGGVLPSADRTGDARPSPRSAAEGIGAKVASKPTPASAAVAKVLSIEDAVSRLRQAIRDAGVLDPSSEAFAAAALYAAIEKSGVKPDERQVAELSKEVRRLAGVWRRYDGDAVDAKRFVAAIQLQVYWYLIPAPNLSEGERRLLAEQHRQLRGVLPSLATRLYEDFGVPTELKPEVTALMKDYGQEVNAFLDSPFLRFMQAPMSPEVFEAQKKKIEENIEKLGQKLRQELDDQREAWKKKARAARPRKPVEYGADLLRSHYSSCRAFLIYMYAEPVFRSCQGNIRYALRNRSKESLFPFGVPDSYGVDSVFYKGVRFKVTPGDKWKWGNER